MARGRSISKVARQHRRRSQGPRGRGKQRHACVACGATDHRLETCPTKAAALIRKLKAENKKLSDSRKVVQMRKRPRRIGPRKTGQYKKNARRAYTGQPVVQQWGRDDVERVKKKEGHRAGARQQQHTLEGQMATWRMSVSCGSQLLASIAGQSD